MKNTNRVCAFLLAFVMLFGTVFTWTAAAENTQTQESFTVDLSERNLIEVSVELAIQLKTCEVCVETDGTQTVLDLDSDGAGDVYLIEGAAKAADLTLTPEEIVYLEEPYVPHPLAGVMAQNKPAAAKEKHVWSTGDQKIGKVKG